MSGSSNIDERFILHEQSLDELYAWIDLVPLSRPKKHISRDFSDAVLCAEVIAHFAPRLVDLHNYAPVSSTIQKKVNWTTLNRKVLAKLGLKLSEGTIQQLSEAKPGVIEQVLFDIRKNLEEFNPAQQNSSQRVTIASSPSSRSTNVSFIRTQPKQSSMSVEYTLDNVPIIAAKSSSSSSSRSAKKKVPIKATPSKTLQYIRSFPSTSYRAQSSITSVYHPPDLPPPPPPRSILMDPSSSSLAQVPSMNNNSSDITTAQLAPTQIIYKGHKMVPQAILEEKDREIKSLQIHVKHLETKVHRIETLVSVKDERIEDLTHQLHEIRSKFERVTQQTWTGFA